MPWLSATAIVGRDFGEALSDALIEAGALSVDVSDAEAGTQAEQLIVDEHGGAPAPGWTRARVSALFDVDAGVAHAMAGALDRSGADPTTAYEVHRIEDEDWVRRTQSQFAPQRITPRLWVVPTWHVPPDPGAINIILDPGLAFGTGTHPTTQLCLRWLDARVRGGESVVDFGCGSGILAIAALKLGAASACGIDIDPEAVIASRANAAQNHAPAIFVSAADELHAPAGIVVANILARPLIVLAPLLATLTADAGHLALSGILEEQAHEVLDAYRPWYDFGPAEAQGGWVLLSGTRRHAEHVNTR